MREVFGEILKKKTPFNINILILDIANAVSRKVLVIKARNF